MVEAGAAFDQLAGRYDECWTTTPWRWTPSTGRGMAQRGGLLSRPR